MNFFKDQNSDSSNSRFFLLRSFFLLSQVVVLKFIYASTLLFVSYLISLVMEKKRKGMKKAFRLRFQ